MIDNNDRSPEHCDMDLIRSQVERLITVLSESRFCGSWCRSDFLQSIKVPARRYAYTLQLMLKKSKKRKSTHSRSPTASRFPPQSQGSSSDRAQVGSSARLSQHEPVSPTYERSYSHHDNNQGSQVSMNVAPQFNADAANLDQIWRGFEGSTNEQLPIWLTDQTLGGNSITQYGLEAFMMPAEYDQRNQFTTPQIW